MLQTNLKDSFEYTYQDIQFAGGKWYAWYYKEIDFQKNLDNQKADK